MTDLTKAVYRIEKPSTMHFNSRERPKTCKDCRYDTDKTDELNGIVCRKHGENICNDYLDYKRITAKDKKATRQ